MKHFLYKCQICGAAVFSNENHGSMWHVSYCGVCKIGQFYEKIVIRENQFILPAIDDEYEFRSVVEEKKDEHSNTRTDQEK